MAEPVRKRCAVPVLLTLLGFVPVVAWAQAPAPAAPAGAGEILIRAETQSAQKGHYEFRGFVDLRAADFRIQADALDYFEDVPEGATAPVRRIEARGNVVFIQGDERLSGTRLRLDLDTATGTFENALGYVTGVFVEGRSIERIDSDTYEIEGGTFTSCAQPVPRWSFSASRARLDVDDRITATNVVLRVKQVPALYLPWFVYPIEEDQRSTGFLFPHFGYSEARGVQVRTGFFWAMGRHADQTFSADTYSRFGSGFGHELRYLRETPSRGHLTTNLFRPAKVDRWDYDLDWTLLQELPGRVRTSAIIREYSHTQIQRQLQDSLDRSSRRTRSSVVNLQRTFGGTTVGLLADNVDTFFHGLEETTRRHRPSFRVDHSPRKLGRSGLVLSLEGRAESLWLGTMVGKEMVTHSWSRFDVWPRLSRPISLGFLQVTPEVQYRYTRWGMVQGEEDELVEGRLDREYLETGVELSGPNFSRVFTTAGHRKLKHVIGPEVRWLRRPAIEVYDQVPEFDHHDLVVGTNQVEYALVQRLYARRAARPGREDAAELLTWRVGQTWYFNLAEDPAQHDPNYVSSNFRPGLVPSHLSPVQSRLRFHPSRRASADFDVEYDASYHTLRRLALAASLDLDRVSLGARWARKYDVDDDGQGTVVITTGHETLRAAARVSVLPDRLSLQGTADYDVFSGRLIHASGRLRYDVQCCGFMAEVVRANQEAPDTRYGFSIELANIGAIGSLSGGGEDESRRRNVGGLR
jgi:hypothetical protein